MLEGEREYVCVREDDRDWQQRKMNEAPEKKKYPLRQKSKKESNFPIAIGNRT